MRLNIFFSFSVLFTFTIFSIVVYSCSAAPKNTIDRLSGDEKEYLGQYHRQIVQIDTYIDGDTFWVKRKDGVRFKVRLIGIDAPETKTVFKKKKHPYGPISANFLKEVLEKQPHLELEFDVDSLDRYGRTLAYVFLKDGTHVNELMIQQGHAQIMTISPNVRYQQRFLQAQQNARKNSLGIWGL